MSIHAQQLKGFPPTNVANCPVRKQSIQSQTLRQSVNPTSNLLKACSELGHIYWPSYKKQKLPGHRAERALWHQECLATTGPFDDQSFLLNPAQGIRIIQSTNPLIRFTKRVGEVHPPLFKPFLTFFNHSALLQGLPVVPVPFAWRAFAAQDQRSKLQVGLPATR